MRNANTCAGVPGGATVKLSATRLKPPTQEPNLRSFALMSFRSRRLVGPRFGERAVWRSPGRGHQPTHTLIHKLGQTLHIRCRSLCHRWRPYRVECTGSLPTSEVKRRRARSVLGWGTAREDLRVLSALVLGALRSKTKLLNTCKWKKIANCKSGIGKKNIKEKGFGGGYPE